MKYPYDIVSLVRNKTFSVEAHFVQKKDESPMKVFDDTFSRFSVTVIADGVPAYFNLPIEALPGIRAKADAAARLQFTPKQVVPAAAEGSIDRNSPAFTAKFFAGKLKGKSPAEVLLEDPANGGTVLNEQYKWLKQNCSNPKYAEGNQKLMDAILAASKLDLSKVKSSDFSGSSSITLLDIGCRPLIRKTRADGKCMVYEGKVVWDTSRRYPVTVTVRNYYANVAKNDDGTLNVNLSSKDTETELVKEFSMTAEEWLYSLGEMESARDCFRMLHFNEGYKLAEAAAAEARNAARHTA